MLWINKKVVLFWEYLKMIVNWKYFAHRLYNWFLMFEVWTPSNLSIKHTNLEVELDSLVAVDFILSNKSANVFLSSIIAKCKCLMEPFERFLSSIFSKKQMHGSKCMCWSTGEMKSKYHQLVDFPLQRMYGRRCILTCRMIFVVGLFILN